MHDRLDHLVTKVRAFATDLATSHRLGPEDGEQLAIVHVACSCVHCGEAVPPTVLDGVAAALSRDAVLEAATGRTGLVCPLDGDADRERAAHALFEQVACRAPGVAGVQVAVARSREAAGDLAGMEAALRQAVSVDAGHRPAHGDLADLAALRGDFRAARHHLDESGQPAIGIAAVAGNLAWGPVRGERNEPCPCRSGQKFKRCCGLTGGWPLELRAELLPARLADWVERPAWLLRRVRFAATAVGLDDLADDIDLAVDAALAPGMVELFLFAGRAIEALAAQVGPVLHADERQVLDRWVAARHDLYELVGRGRRRHLLRDRSGAVRAVTGPDRDLLDGRRTTLLAVLVPRPTPDGDVWQVAGDAVPLDDDGDIERIRALLDGPPDPVTLAGAAIAPILHFQRLARAAASAPDPARAERLRWLFGDDVDVDRLDDDGAVDDLVTTTYLRGGGFSAAADCIRLAGRQIAGGEPPELWAMAEQLTAAGHDRQTVLVHLAVARYAAGLAGPDPQAVREALLSQLEVVPARIAGEPR